jgi:hypothetical protein
VEVIEMNFLKADPRFEGFRLSGAIDFHRSKIDLLFLLF